MADDNSTFERLDSVIARVMARLERLPIERNWAIERSDRTEQLRLDGEERALQAILDEVGDRECGSSRGRV